MLHAFNTIDYIRKLFKEVRFSEEDSNAREKEQNSYMMFLDYLEECEKGTLDDVCAACISCSELKDGYC